MIHLNGICLLGEIISFKQRTTKKGVGVLLSRMCLWNLGSFPPHGYFTSVRGHFEFQSSKNNHPTLIHHSNKKNPIRVIPYEIDYMKNTIKFRKKIVIVVFHIINLKGIRTVGKGFPMVLAKHDYFPRGTCNEFKCFQFQI